jgi:hypothetical protein
VPSTTIWYVKRQPGGDTDVWRDILAHRDLDEVELAVARFELARVPVDLVSATLRDLGDALFTACRSGEADWAREFGGSVAVALLAAEVSALAAHLNSRAASVRAAAVELLLDDFSAVSVAEELGVSRQKVYDIARASHRTATYIPRVPWRSHERHV